MNKSVVLVFVVASLALVYFTNGELNEHRIVETLNGCVRGHLKHTLYKNVSYYAFLGIPYAEKPIGNLRFQV